MAEERTGTIDFGIDLGTTTSSIAKVDGNDTVIIPNRVDNRNYVTSAVYIKKDGTIFIGDKAKRKIAIDPHNGYSEFKLKMGISHIYEFEASGIEMTPIELSAEILKFLKNSAMEEYPDKLESIVITVPADFTTPQTKATTEAAKLAGFKQVIILQEPAAAAIAYGFNSSDENEIWMVYDFGGGTFDVSIMKKDRGEIVNINNDGDTYLGGKLIDWDIVDKILAPAVIEETGLADFSRSNIKYLKQFAKLKKAAEIAKRELSTYDTTEIYIEYFLMDNDGNTFDFEYEMSKQELEDIMKPYVDRSINHCKHALDDVNMTYEDISRVILVGGSSLSPYVQRRLSEEFKVPLEYSIDPTTVVARGAAIFAGTKKIKILPQPKDDEVAIDVKYDTIGENREFEVFGKISNVTREYEGFTVEIINDKTGSSTGRISVNKNGVFFSKLSAEDDENFNIFEINVYDASGNQAKLSKDSVNTIKYKCTRNIGPPIMSHTMGLGLYSNDLFVIAEKGTPLPYEFSGTFRTTEPVRIAESDEKIYMPLYEGNKMKADRNILIGYLSISSQEIAMDLPVNSEIELSVSIDDSMNIDSRVFVPYLNQEFNDALRVVSGKVSYDSLVEKFDNQKGRYLDLLSMAFEVNDDVIQKMFNRITDENMLDNIETFLKTSKTDIDALDNANKRINDFTDILDRAEEYIESKFNFSHLKKETDSMISKIEDDIDMLSPESRNLYMNLKEIYNNVVESKNDKLLNQIKDKLLYIIFNMDRPKNLEDMFTSLVAHGNFRHPDISNKLIAEGYKAIENKDYDGLERIISHLARLSNDFNQEIYVDASDDNQPKSNIRK